MKPQKIDKSLVEERFCKCLPTYDAQATVQYNMAERLVALLRKECGESFPRVLEIGFGTGLFGRQIVKAFDVNVFWSNDIVAECAMNLYSLGPEAPHVTCMFVPGDIESVDRFPDRFDLIASNATFQWIQDLPSLLKRLVSHLSPGGTLAFGTFGPDNFEELRELTGMALQYHDATALRKMMPAGMKALSMEEYKVVLRFASPGEMLDHIRATGSNALVRTSWAPGALAKFESDYKKSFSFEGGVRLTYHPILVVARKDAS